MLKVLIKDTGYITWVSEEYYERYKMEGIKLLVDSPVEKLPEINDNPKDIPKHTLKESIEIKKVPMKRTRRKTK